MEQPLDWTKLASLLLGLLGTLLGLYNLITTRKERRLKERQGFALTLMTLESLLDKLIAVPLDDPQDLHLENIAAINRSLEIVGAAIDADRKDLVSSIPEMASMLINVRESCRTLLTALSDPTKEPANALDKAAEFLLAASVLAEFRGTANQFEISLSNRGQPWFLNESGDDKAEILLMRYYSFGLSIHERNDRLRGLSLRST